MGVLSVPQSQLNHRATVGFASYPASLTLVLLENWETAGWVWNLGNFCMLSSLYLLKIASYIVEGIQNVFAWQNTGILSLVLRLLLLWLQSQKNDFCISNKQSTETAYTQRSSIKKTFNMTLLDNRLLYVVTEWRWRCTCPRVNPSATHADLFWSSGLLGPDAAQIWLTVGLILFLKTRLCFSVATQPKGQRSLITNHNSWGLG